jgi:hypothetical protein
MPDIEAAVQRWRDAGPLDADSTKLLIDLKDANLTDQPSDLIWAAFVRSLNPEQKSALLDLLQIVDRDEAFR